MGEQFHTPDESMLIHLKQSLLKERDSTLSEVSDDFYQKLHVEMKNLEGKELQNTNDLLNEFVRIRHSKIVQFASVLKSGNIIENNMSDEERDLFFMMQHCTKLFYKKIIL